MGTPENPANPSLGGPDGHDLSSAVQKRDFPLAQRGYDPAAVDAHLRALAAEVEELQRALAGGDVSSLAATAGIQVDGIIEAAKSAAAEIESEARARAEEVSVRADREAQRTRADAFGHAQARVAAVAKASATLLARLESLDREAGALLEGLRTGARTLASDLAALERNMAELYDAASGPVGATATGPATAAPTGGPLAPADADRTSERPPGSTPAVSTSAPPEPPRPEPAPSAPQAVAAAGPPGAGAGQGPAANGDLDGARLIALNMALNGSPRADTDRYLAENFTLADRAKLVDEVYAAIEG